jgi:hypothetical protein
MILSHDVWTWIGALLSLAIFSFLYKDNPFYKTAEHIFVGITNGYAVTFYWHNILVPVLFNPLFRGRLILIIPLIIGALYFTRFIPKVSWMVRIPIGITIGYYTGVSIPANIEANIVKQVQGTILSPANFRAWHAGSWGILWSVLLFIGVLCVVSYFYFSREHKGLLKLTSRIGIVFIMIGFGAAFGYTVMGRISLLIGRLNFLFGNWLGIIK